MADLALSGVKKRFGEVEVIHGFDLEITDGEFVVIVGPSGCGKSTVLRLICGLERFSEGEVTIDGQSMQGISPSKRGVAMVFQSYALYPHMSVAENMGFSLRMAKLPRAEREDRIRRAAEILRLDQLLERKPKQLSGGQRQRVAIGRAIVREPKVFLFDEPLSNLDAELRVQMRFELAKLHRKLGATMIYVTHDQVEAMTLADRIVVMNEGNIEQVGTPLELYRKPVNRFVAGFIGSPRMNFLEARIIDRKNHTAILHLPGLMEDGIAITLPAGQMPAEDRVILGIRPEHLVPNGQGANHLTAEIEFVEQLGGNSFLYAPAFPAGPLIIKGEGDHEAPELGQALTARIDPANCHIFTSDGTTVKVK
jgi:ABC-type sugar transport system ATPase subunit